MILDPAAADSLRIYQMLVGLIVPRPIAWVSTISAEGAPNWAPFSFFTGVGVAPPSLAFSVLTRGDGTEKDTLRNIRATGEFVVNVVPFAMAAAMNASSAEIPPEVNEFDRAGIAPRASSVVRPASVSGSPACFECRLTQVVKIGDGPWSGNLVIGEIVSIRVDETVLDERGRVAPELLDAIGRMGGVGTYVRTTDLFEMRRPEKEG